MGTQPSKKQYAWSHFPISLGLVALGIIIGLFLTGPAFAVTCLTELVAVDESLWALSGALTLVFDFEIVILVLVTALVDELG